MAGDKGCIVGTPPATTTAATTTSTTTTPTTTTTVSNFCPPEENKLNKTITILSNRDEDKYYDLVYLQNFFSFKTTSARNKVKHLKLIAVPLRVLFQQTCAIDCKYENECYTFKFEDNTCALGGVVDDDWYEDIGDDEVYVNMGKL